MLFFKKPTPKPPVTEEIEIVEKKEEKEILYSKSVKAGKRIYYLDVKKDRKDDLFIAITESKKKNTGADGQFSFEKHKIFLYKEDFDKFETALTEVLDYIRQSSNSPITIDQEDTDTKDEIGE
jgi:hypothetical protein